MRKRWTFTFAEWGGMGVIFGLAAIAEILDRVRRHRTITREDRNDE